MECKAQTGKSDSEFICSWVKCDARHRPQNLIPSISGLGLNVMQDADWKI